MTLTADSSPDPEIVRKVAEALQHHLPVNLVGGSTLCLCDVTRTYEGPVGQRLHAAAAALAVAEPLIREQVAQEIEASRATNTFRTTVLERAAKIARGGQ